MALGPRLELRQSQRLSMTPQLRQAISLLQMTNLELLAHLAEEVEKNPLLELDEVLPDDGAEQEMQVDWRIDSVPSASISGVEDFDQIGNIEKFRSLRELLIEQIQISDRDPYRTKLSLILVDELNEQGFVDTPVFEIADRLGVPQADIENALTLLQSCDPVGIGARNLAECLELQLRDCGDFDDIMRVMISNLDVVGAGDIPALIKLADASEDSIRSAIDRLQHLNPRPGMGYETDVIQAATPDVIISKNASGGWTVEAVTDSLPKLLINERYVAEISKDGVEVTEFLTECRANARFLLKAMDQRAKTILRVATLIVRHQSLFFDIGVNGLRPLTLADIAAELGIHESTVSRVTSGKFLYCARGNFELRFFFVKGIGRANGLNDIAAPVVREKIRVMIGEEQPNNVLSDESITNLLKDEGVMVARRTVAKYRESMGILSSSRRRKRRN